MWWDRYQGQETVIMDEVNEPIFPYHTLLEIGNLGSYQVPFKGGYAEFTSRRFTLISNIEPQQVYSKDFAVNPDALLRRCIFYRCTRGGPHELIAQEVRYIAPNWVDVGAPMVKHVDYEEDRIVKRY